MKVFIEMYCDFLRFIADEVSDETIEYDSNFLKFVHACIKMMKENRGE